MWRTFFFLAVLMTVCLWVSAQGQQSKEPQGSPPSDTSKLTNGTIGVDGPIQVLSDTSGVDLKPYLDVVLAKIKKNWYDLIPPVARAPVSRQGKLSIEFEVMRDGQIQNVRYRTSSGDLALDRAAYDGITTSSPFPALPVAFVSDYLELRFNFSYNPSQRALFHAAVVNAKDLEGAPAPIILYAPPPRYTKRAREAKEEGSVLLSLTVDKHGNAKNIRVVRSLSADLDAKAVKAVKKWDFKAAMKDGQPVAADMNVEVPFELSSAN